MKVFIGDYSEDSGEREVDVQIDYSDVYSMDHTLAHIVLPMLKELRKRKVDAPWTDDEDVPERLRSTNAPPKENDWDIDELHFKRWNWILDQMIFSFETKKGMLQDWEDQFWVYEPEFKCVDKEGYEEFQDKIRNGFRLFGKYYECLWV